MAFPEPIGGNTSIFMSQLWILQCRFKRIQMDVFCSFQRCTGWLIRYPFLFLQRLTRCCVPETAKLSVVFSPGAIIQWRPPFVGNDTIQYAFSSGIYTCKVTSCGITTLASVTITFANPQAIITVSPSNIICPTGDSVTLTANNGMILYIWEPGSIAARIIHSIY